VREEPLGDRAREAGLGGAGLGEGAGVERVTAVNWPRVLIPTPVSPARGPPIDWGEFVQVHDDRAIFQESPDELPVIDIHNRLWAVPDATHACRETANWDAVCADTRKTPPKRVRGVSRNPLRTPGPLLPRLTSRSSAGRPVRRGH
jgi:hypothetical protein